MKKIILAFLLFPLFSFAQSNRQPSFDLTGVPISQVLSLYYKEVAKSPYVMCNEVIQDTRLVSIRAEGELLNDAVLFSLLDSYGYEITLRRGVATICTKKQVTESIQDVDFGDPYVYKPKYRDASYIVDILAPLFKGKFANKRGGGGALTVGGDSSDQAISSSFNSQFDEFIIFSGSDIEKSRLERLLSSIDIPSGEVVVKGHVYEVGSSASEGSALEMLASLLKGKVELSFDSGSLLSNSLRIKTGSIDFVASALNTDGRFKILTTPYTRLKSGGRARFQVGADVPVLGAIVTNNSGQSQQSIEYRSAGTLLEVSAFVKESTIDIELFQQISNFVVTESGVNNSPTLNKREIKTSLSVEDGEILVIGGLNEATDEANSSGLWFLPFATSKSSRNKKSELLLILEVRKI